MANDLDDQDILSFAADDVSDGAPPTLVSTRPPISPWKVLIVDDEPSVHEVTKITLGNVLFDGRPIKFLSAYNGADGVQTAQDNPDLAMILLDVVMETEHAGLEVARRVREELNNHSVRIVLRTGQPGHAPERKVITEYDINDYKEKTELTANKLFTVLYASLRAFQSIVSIEKSKKGLATVIEASADIFKLSSLQNFATGVLEQLTALLQLNFGAIYLQGERVHGLSGVAASFEENHWHTIAGVGKYQGARGNELSKLIDRKELDLVSLATKQRVTIYEGSHYVAYLEDRLGNRNILLIEGVDQLDKVARDFVDLFLRNVAIAFENVYLHSDLDKSQREIIFLLSEAVEKRSQETGNHVRRVAEMSRIIAEGIGLGEREADLIKQASPLHDLGKIGIPDSILKNPNTLTEEEREIMRQHAEIGYKMLCSSSRSVLKAAADIAHQHHERWDGRGYPRGLAGADIAINARITAAVDVFDALLSARCYKPAWPLEKVLELFRKERGGQFDPAVVDVLFGRIDEITAVRARLPD